MISVLRIISQDGSQVSQSEDSPPFHACSKAFSLFRGILWEIEKLICGFEYDWHIIKDGSRPGASEIEIEHAYCLASMNELLYFGSILVNKSLVVDDGQRGHIFCRTLAGHGENGQKLMKNPLRAQDFYSNSRI